MIIYFPQIHTIPDSFLVPISNLFRDRLEANYFGKRTLIQHQHVVITKYMVHLAIIWFLKQSLDKPITQNIDKSVYVISTHPGLRKRIIYAVARLNRGILVLLLCLVLTLEILIFNINYCSFLHQNVFNKTIIIILINLEHLFHTYRPISGSSDLIHILNALKSSVLDTMLNIRSLRTAFCDGFGSICLHKSPSFKSK